MFTGLIEEIGKVLWIRATDRGTQLQVAAPLIAEGVRRGDSIAVNGCCLTVKTRREDQITFDLLEETLDRTNLRALRRDSSVNLERSLSAQSLVGGHFVQGHIDCAVKVLAFEQNGSDHRLEIALPGDFSHYVAYKGSVAVNGISLTVAEVLPESFAVWIIPHTKRHTNLDSVGAGDRLNLEFDLLAKYVERMMTRSASQEQSPSSASPSPSMGAG
ncbi:MAG: riboflavin synthase [Chthoniobacterales bacterium]